ncbi:MAG: capsule assembly Wzi family protein [Marinagarivorans sp.]|nr:capsule assembly Wzi family protein [Marinagarivorans sp.]
MLVRSIVKLALLLTGLLGLSAGAYASPWIDVGDAHTRHHLQYLVDAGTLKLPTSTWPLPWASVKHALDEINTNTLTADQLWSVNYLNHALTIAMDTAVVASRSRISKNPEIFNHFGSDSREAEEASIGINLMTNAFALRLAGTYVDEPSDKNNLRADGSYLAVATGNWAIGVGAVDQWWGPGHQSSMILSNNARPAPGIFIKRAKSDAFDTPVLSWLGQWQFMAFMNRLNNGEDIDSLGIQTPLLWGTRLNFVPLRGFEVGLSRTALWGGKDQDQDFGHFKDVVLNDNSKDISQQLASLDVRYGRSINRATLAIYGQWASKEGFTDVVDHSVALAGIEVAGMLGSTHNRIMLESSNSIEGLTAVDGNDHKDFNDNTYEHRRYSQGYRYHQRHIAISSDSHSKTLTFAGQHYFDNGHRLTWRWIRADINSYPQTPINMDAFSTVRSQVNNTQLQYRLPIFERVMMAVGVSLFDHPIVIHQNTIDSSFELSFFHFW